jgi:hypothetical protein
MHSPTVTKRLQVLLDDEELAAIRRAARERRQSVAEWVRVALRRARTEEAVATPAAKLSALHAATMHEFPTGPIEQLLAEIADGYREAP